MKTKNFLITLLLTTPIWAADTISPIPTNDTSHTIQQIDAEVVKAYVVHEGKAEFRAYVIMWKGHEVVVSDTLAETNFRKGDKIKVFVLQGSFPHGKEKYDLLHFEIVHGSPPPVFRPQANDSIQHSTQPKPTP